MYEIIQKKSALPHCQNQVSLTITDKSAASERGRFLYVRASFQATACVKWYSLGESTQRPVTLSGGRIQAVKSRENDTDSEGWQHLHTIISVLEFRLLLRLTALQSCKPRFIGNRREQLHKHTLGCKPVTTIVMPSNQRFMKSAIICITAFKIFWPL